MEKREIDKILEALDSIQFGSVEITIHDSKIVQIEIRERIRFDRNKYIELNPTKKLQS